MELNARFNTDKKQTLSAIFTDLKTAERICYELHRNPENIEKITIWLDPHVTPVLELRESAKKARLDFIHEGFGYPIGKILKKSGNIEDVTRAKMILKKDHMGGYYILTAYPIK